MILDRSVDIRCVLAWAAFVAAAVVGICAFGYNSDRLGRAAMITASLGFVMVVLNDNARTRRFVQLAIVELIEGEREPVVPFKRKL